MNDYQIWANMVGPEPDMPRVTSHRIPERTKCARLIRPLARRNPSECTEPSFEDDWDDE